MKTAIIVMEGTPRQGAFVGSVIASLLAGQVQVKAVVSYQIGDKTAADLERAVAHIGAAWPPVASRMLKPVGGLDLGEVKDLRSAIADVDQCISRVLGPANVALLQESVFDYHVIGRLPIEWLLHRGWPLAMYAPFYRYAKPQHMLSLHAPLDNARKLLIVPKYSSAKYAGINAATRDIPGWIGKDPRVTILEGVVTRESLSTYGARQFASLAFFGHATPEGLLDSNGSAMPPTTMTGLVQGPAFVVGCSTGAFEPTRLDGWASQIPSGLHGAMLCAFPAPGRFLNKVNEVITSTFRHSKAQRVQDIAHMARLALAYLSLIDGMRALANIPFRPDLEVVSVTPFEAAYDDEGYFRWGAGPARIERELQSMDSVVQDFVRALAGAMAMAVVSCGTPVFLTAAAPPESRKIVDAFNRWDGRV